MQHQDTIKHVGDALSLSVVVGTIAAWLPAMAALLSIVWTLIRIYETSTFQKFIAWWRE
jgi:hypothetical protein